MAEGLIGRTAELARIRAFRDEATVHGGALVVLGEPGAGKTALLDAAARSAHDAGARVLRAAGVEYEADVSFAALDQLLLPLERERDALPAGLRTALSSALGSGEGPPPARLVVANAVLETLRLAGSQRALLVLIDDLPWIDRPTAGILGFAARRLRGTRVALLAASRTDARSFFDLSGLVTLELGALDDEAAAALLDERFPTLPERVRVRVLAEADGNPLALVELPGALRDAQFATARALPSVLPLSRRLQDIFGARLAGLPAATRSLLLLAGLEGTGDLRVLLAGAENGLADLAPAEEARLVYVADATHRLEFRHPLIRSSVVELSTGEQRRRTHGALASLLGDEPERAAWHLAEAAVDPDEQAAAQLERAAQRMLRRGDAVGAVAALIRAADLSPSGADRARRLALGAYVGADVTGNLRDVSDLLLDARNADAAGGGSLAPAMAAAYLLLNGEGDLDTAHRLLVGAIEGHPPMVENDHLLAEALHTLMLICFFGARPDLWPPFDDALARLEPHVPVALWLCSKTFRDPARTGTVALERLERTIGELGAEADPSHIARVAMAAFYVDRRSGCREALWRVVRDGRHGGAVTSAIDALMVLAFDDYLTGSWDAAHELLDEGLALCKAGGYELLAWPGRFGQALLAASHGEDKVVDELTAAMKQWAAPRGAHVVEVYALHARGLAALGRGDYEQAYRHATAITPPGTLGSHVAHALWVTMDLVEAAVHTGRHAEAAAHVGAMREADISALSSRLALLVAGSEAIASADTSAGDLFVRALELPEAGRWPFELARLELAFGERLRRDGRMTDAREHLHAALEIFEHLAARPWARRAEADVRATGASRARRGTWQSEHLTPQESEIAQLAASGLTNKEIGGRLYLSHRTVSAHLYRIFPKLGITSRAALRDALQAPTESDDSRP